MLKKLLSLIFCSFLLASCHHSQIIEPELPGFQPGDSCVRTLLVYMEARNNLNNEALADLEEMRQAAIPAGNRLLVYRSRRGDDHPVLCEIFKGGDSVLLHYPDSVLATDPAHMAKVIADTRSIAPSREFAMIFWSHASGWRQLNARGFGSENGNAMTTTQLAAGLAGDRKIDYLFFDCCYMGSAEVAYELRNSARYFVASPCEVPAGGMPYHLTIPELFNPDMEQGLRNAINITVDYYRSDPMEDCPSTLSLVNLAAMDQLIDSVKKISSLQLPATFMPQRFSVNSPYNNMFADLGQYMEALGSRIPDGVILHEQHTDRIWNRLSLVYCCGLTVFIPDLRTGIDYSYKGYNTLQWAKYLNLK
ncbi:MAG: hypothetical protein K2N10_00300 [Muribaculaceae bacterium]|nr:hypothetical protein [Muribaculaceae bacterium]